MWFKKQSGFSDKKKSGDLVGLSSRELLDENKKIRDNISYLDSQYGIFVLKSLISEFDKFKFNIENHIKDTPFWKIGDYDSKSVNLIKSLDPNNIWKNTISISIEYDGKNIEGPDFKIKSINLDCNHRKISLPKSEFSEIISRYILIFAIFNSKQNLKNSKDSFEYLINILGKDVHRDLKIEKILK